MVITELFVVLLVQVEHEVLSEELSLINDLVRGHQLSQLLFHWAHEVSVRFKPIVVLVGLFNLFQNLDIFLTLNLDLS